jgi:hypothetical protein
MTIDSGIERKPIPIGRPRESGDRVRPMDSRVLRE